MNETALTQLADLVFDILKVVVVPFAAWLVHRAIKAVETKTKVDVPQQIEDKVDTWIDQGISLAIEKSHQKLKKKTEELSGPEKLEVAADYVFGLVENNGYDDWTKDLIKKKIESKLGTTRAVP